MCISDSAADWLFFRRGLGATNHFEGGGFVRSNEDVDYPNLMFHFLPIAIRYDGTSPVKGHGYQVHIGPMYSDARGTLRIRSANPHDKPAMTFNYLSTDQDRREWVEAIRVARDILTQPAFEPFNSGEISPGPGVETDEEILDWVRHDAETALHPSCTARMGVDGESVLDPLTMRVHGVEGLRVVDASSMPYVTNGNIYAPVMLSLIHIEMCIRDRLTVAARSSAPPTAPTSAPSPRRAMPTPVRRSLLPLSLIHI